MRLFGRLLAFLGLVSVHCVAQADEPLRLEPSSVWAMNYAEDSCRLIRLFGEGDNQVRFELRMFAPGSSPWALISGEAIETSSLGTVLVRYRYNPDDRDVERYALGGKLDGVPAIMFSSSLETYSRQRKDEDAYFSDREAWTIAQGEYDPERETQIDSLEVDISRGSHFVLELGSMHAPMQAMRACLDDLLVEWGVDADILGTNGKGLPPIPTNNPGKWISSSDYPRRMLVEGRGDKVDFRLSVDKQGKPTDCTILTMEARSEFTDVTCAILMRQARFKPATDADGNPVNSVYVNSVRFIIR